MRLETAGGNLVGNTKKLIALLTRLSIFALRKVERV